MTILTLRSFSENDILLYSYPGPALRSSVIINKVTRLEQPEKKIINE